MPIRGESGKSRGFYFGRGARKKGKGVFSEPWRKTELGWPAGDPAKAQRIMEYLRSRGKQEPLRGRLFVHYFHARRGGLT